MKDLFGYEPQEKVARPNWAAEARAIWHDQTGGFIAFGRIAVPLKPLVELYGWDEVRLALRYFLKVAILQYATPELFARSYNQWIIPKLPKTIAPTWKEIQDGKRMRLVPDDAA